MRKILVSVVTRVLVAAGVIAALAFGATVPASAQTVLPAGNGWGAHVQLDGNGWG
jgi:hypothetical protein